MTAELCALTLESASSIQSTSVTGVHPSDVNCCTTPSSILLLRVHVQLICKYRLGAVQSKYRVAFLYFRVDLASRFAYRPCKLVRLNV